MPNDRLCPMSVVAGCREACLVSAGRAAFTPGIGRARAGRTAFFEADRTLFMRLLVLDIRRLINTAKKNELTPVVRLNGTSDIDWSSETIDGASLFDMFPDVQFYDYTKRPDILRKSKGISNWHTTASYSEHSEKYRRIITTAARKYDSNLAVVFSSALPQSFKGIPVISGDATDLRFKDSQGVIVGLKAKGSARKDTSGFVV